MEFKILEKRFGRFYFFKINVKTINIESKGGLYGFGCLTLSTLAGPMIHE
jgi:phosphatidate phosphatase PAH1